MKKIITLLALLVTSCSSQSRHITLAHDIMNSFSNEVRCTDQLAVFGSGGAMQNDVEVIKLAYFSEKRVDVDGARKILISVATRLIDRVNSSEAIRPYLHNYPFTEKNINLSISFVGKNFEEPPPPWIASARIGYDKVSYSINNPERGILQNALVETYAEALSKVNSQ